MKMAKMIIDGKGLILGRASTFIAQRLLRGDEVVLLNATDMVVSGNRLSILEEERALRDVGSNVGKGPFYQRRPRAFVKRTIRGMLPKNARGELALKRLRVHDTGVEGLVADTTIEGAAVGKLPNSKFSTVGSITRAMGGTR
jgi:large subunit ribosomal protein L13